MKLMILCLSNQKGGVGKTTSAANLAAFLCGYKLSVLLVDFDPQSNLSSGLGIIDAKKTIYTLLSGNASADEVIVATQQENLFLIPSSSELSGASVELIHMEQRESYLKRVLHPLRNSYDIIIIDCPPSLGILTLNALCASNEVLIPLQCEFYALDGVVKLIRTISLVKQRFNPTLEIFGIILTMYDNRTNLSLEVSNEIKKIFGNKVFQTIIPRNVRIAEAPSHGKTILQYDKASRGALSYNKLAEEVLQRWKKRKEA